MYDPDLHLFVTDDEVFAIRHLKPMVQTWQKDEVGAVLLPNDEGEETAIGYATAIYDRKDQQIKLWYVMHSDGLIRLAISRDGRSWRKYGTVMDSWPAGSVDNLHVTVPTNQVDAWFHDARFVGTAHFTPAQRTNKYEAGIYGIRSPDGERWEVRLPALLPNIGDRSALAVDRCRGLYMLTSRPARLISKTVGASKPRKIALWESYNLTEWEERGIVLRADENDDEDLQLYGMVPFRYGAGFLGLLEVYHRDIGRLDTQLACSADGLHWQRGRGREVVLPLGGEGAWDSHWVVPTLNPPLLLDNRLVLLYSGASTKAGSGVQHRRAIGIASLRLDGWVSLEAGQTEGQVVTTSLPLEHPMELEINVSCPTGYFSAEVLDSQGKPIGPYGLDAGRLERVDLVRQRMSWGDRTTVSPVPNGLCRLRFALFQGSLFSYRWHRARESA